MSHARVSPVPRASQPITWAERALGRSLAAAVHPVAAWTRFSSHGRMLLAGGYFAAAYLSILAALLIVAGTR
jgi:hypothetical protein